jgi:hypothetical protein
MNNNTYIKNIFLSAYGVISFVFTSLFVFFVILFFLKILTGDPTNFKKKQQDLAEKEEKRLNIRLRKEKKPPKFATNENFNQKKTQKDFFLSKDNSASVSPLKAENNSGRIRTENTGEMDELSLKSGEKSDAGQPEKSIFDKENSIESVFGKSLDKKKKSSKNKNDGFQGNSFRNNMVTAARLNGAELVGTQISLSTYKWDWFPYIEIMKKKIYQFWTIPPAYQLGLIYGATRIKFKISQKGKLVAYQMIRHQGSKSLQKSSEDVILAIFDMPPLPPDFPDPELEIGIVLIYPRLK